MTRKPFLPATLTKPVNAAVAFDKNDRPTFPKAAKHLPSLDNTVSTLRYSVETPQAATRVGSVGDAYNAAKVAKFDRQAAGTVKGLKRSGKAAHRAASAMARMAQAVKVSA
jgi:hypothetical protein